jgi:hypothetical protein
MARIEESLGFLESNFWSFKYSWFINFKLFNLKLHYLAIF